MAAQFASSQFRNAVASLLRQSGINPQRLHLRAWEYAVLACKAAARYQDVRASECATRIVSFNHP